MRKKILILGGTRFFGIRLVRRLLAEGHALTIATRGRQPDEFGDRVARRVLDRHDDALVHRALAQGEWDLAYDQTCYGPQDARTLLQALSGRAGRLVTASTIEVYRPLRGAGAPHGEAAFAPADEPVDWQAPWRDPAGAEARYAAGKRQMEAVLAREATLPVAVVRIAHVLGGAGDFTGRLAQCVLRAAQGRAPHAGFAGPSSFLHPQAIADFLAWAGAQDFTGPVNAACDGALTGPGLHERALRALGRPQVGGEPDAGPFDHAHDFRVDTTRARALGFDFGRIEPALDALLREHVEALS